NLSDRLLNWLEKMSAQLSDEITSPSQALTQICREAWRLPGINDIPNPVAVPDAPTIQARDTLVVGYLPGRFDTYKSFPTLARTLLSYLPKADNKFRFLLLGSDHAYGESTSLLQEINQWVDDGSGTRPITLLPRKTRSEVQEISKGLDVVLVASRFENAPYV